MSTELKSTENHFLTRYWGGKERGHCVQVTQKNCGEPSYKNPGFINLTRPQALELGEALLAFGNRQEQEE